MYTRLCTEIYCSLSICNQVEGKWHTNSSYLDDPQFFTLDEIETARAVAPWIQPCWEANFFSLDLMSNFLWVIFFLIFIHLFESHPTAITWMNAELFLFRLCIFFVSSPHTCCQQSSWLWPLAAEQSLDIKECHFYKTGPISGEYVCISARSSKIAWRTEI